MLLLLLDETGPSPVPAYPTELSPEYIGTHVEDAQNLLLEQFKNSTTLHALLASYTKQIQTAEDGINPLVLSRDINVAVGVPLDALGEAVGIARNGLGDEVYRLFIRAKILVNKSSGTGDNLIAIVRQMSGDPALDVKVDEYDPATVWIRPVDHIITDPDLWAALLRLAKSAGVRLLFIYNKSAESAMFQYAATAGTIGTGRGFDQGHFAGDA